jgi:hypothetical protein
MEPALGCRLLDHQAALGCLTVVANSIDEALALLVSYCFGLRPDRQLPPIDHLDRSWRQTRIGKPVRRVSSS